MAQASMKAAAPEAVIHANGVIGGMFALPDPVAPKRPRKPPFINGNSVTCANASSGIAVLCALLEPPRVWLPSYLCGAIREAVEWSKAKAAFYEVDYDLNCRSAAWMDDIQQRDVVVLIDYFGFPYPQRFADDARSRGAWVLEDASQALLSDHVGRNADFVVFSPRKFVGVPDGGILWSKSGLDLRNSFPGELPDDWWLKALRASIGRRDFDLYGKAGDWFQLFQETEANRPIGPYQMSRLSDLLLRNCFDYDAIAESRLSNYRYLSHALGELALFPRLPPGVVPLGFPVRVENRPEVLQALYRRQIFPPVHWNLEGVIPKRFKESRRLSQVIMTLPCDQRYKQADMERMVSALRKAISQSRRGR